MKVIPTVIAICVTFLCTNTAKVFSSSPSSCGQPQQGLLLFEADLTEGTHSIPDPTAVTMTQVLVPPAAGSIECDMEGVVKITFPTATNGIQNRKIRVDLYFKPLSVPPSGISFHIGDSVLNSGDITTPAGKYSAEVFGVNNDWKVHTNKLPGRGEYTTGDVLAGSTLSIISDHITVVVGDEFVKFDNHRGV